MYMKSVTKNTNYIDKNLTSCEFYDSGVWLTCSLNARIVLLIQEKTDENQNTLSLVERKQPVKPIPYDPLVTHIYIAKVAFTIDCNPKGMGGGVTGVRGKKRSKAEGGAQLVERARTTEVGRAGRESRGTNKEMKKRERLTVSGGDDAFCRVARLSREGNAAIFLEEMEWEDDS
ncbi:hypothetical protein C8R41DRAFT_871949 [Lentinula lateritia]|uniref:Uncharacterized protein n=1 Tax=Lentinula lateritia TaxID=40482 RepID=A0ABQ8UY70_9AGAR|nr:hypothetical protein C8R41DRAFT_871949 [Lentinula lateritia]